MNKKRHLTQHEQSQHVSTFGVGWDGMGSRKGRGQWHTSYARAFLCKCVPSVAPSTFSGTTFMIYHRHSTIINMHQRARPCSTPTRGTSHSGPHAWFSCMHRLVLSALSTTSQLNMLAKLYQKV
jgi:hypothetical protein